MWKYSEQFMLEDEKRMFLLGQNQPHSASVRVTCLGFNPDIFRMRLDQGL